MPEQVEADIILASSQEIEAVQDLWNEYWHSLGLSADFQSFAEECATLPGAYAPPAGRLLLALVEGSPAATVALRPLSGRSCEAKRLYVRPRYRGRGIGAALLGRLVQEARAEGYKEIYCDTLKSMQAAQRLYAQMGFLEVQPYSSNPTPDAVFLKLAL